MTVNDSTANSINTDQQRLCFLSSALIIYGGDTDYSRRFQKEGNDFLVDDDKFTLMRENDSLVVSFASGKLKINHYMERRGIHLSLTFTKCLCINVKFASVARIAQLSELTILT